MEKKIETQDVLRIADVWHADLSTETVEVLNAFFTSYYSPHSTGNLYSILTYDHDLNNTTAAVSPECRGELEQLRTLCRQHDATYLWVSRPAPPGQQRVRYYTPDECAEIGRIGIVLTDHYCLALCKAAQQGYIGAVDILHSWALEFFESYGYVENDAQEWDDVIIQWGGQRLQRFQAEGA